MDSKKIFLSYSRDDGDSYALRLAEDLSRNNAIVWLDKRSIFPGTTFDDAIEEGLKSSDFVLFVATEKSTQSPFCKNELHYAQQEKKTVIPVLFHKNCRLPLILQRTQFIDFSNDYEKAFLSLLERLKLKLPIANVNEKIRQRGGNRQKGKSNLLMLIGIAVFVLIIVAGLLFLTKAGRPSNIKNSELTVKEDSLTNANTDKQEHQITANFTFTGGEGQATLSVFSEGILVKSFQVTKSGFIAIPVRSGLYYISGSATGRVAVDIFGERVTVRPTMPVSFSPGIFSTAFLVDVKQ